MKKIIVLLLLSASISLKASIIDDVWKSLENQDRKQARMLLNKALQLPEFKVDAAMTLIFLNSLENKKENLDLMNQVFPAMPNPSPYLYSLWFNDAVTNGYDKKDDKRLKIIEDMLLSKKVNGSIHAGAQYVLGLHLLFSNKIEEASKEWAELGALKNWQLTGSFDNSSGSGFNKNYPPVYQAKPDSKFISATNSDIYWFEPKNVQLDPWVMTHNYIQAKQGIIYAQTFVNSPQNMDAILAMGGSGSLKIWLNDQLIMEQEDERATELDVFKRPIKLLKGDNRILVQVGFTQNTAYPNFIVRLLDSNLEHIKELTSSASYKPYSKVTESSLKPQIEHFAEAYFKDKIKEHPEDLINYLLLSKYYYRMEDINHSIEVLNQAQKRYPNNVLIKYETLLNYSKIHNRTEVLKQVEHLRKIDPDLIFLKYYDFNNAINKEDYAEAEEIINKIKEVSVEDDADYLESYLKLLGGKKDYQQLISVAEKAFEKYPENIYFLTMKYYILKNKSKSPNEAAQLLEKFLKNNFNSSISDLLLKEYESLGNNTKLESYLLDLHEKYPEESKFINLLYSNYYKSEKYRKGLEVLELGQSNSPFSSSYWLDKSYFHSALKMKDEAIFDLGKAIHYDPNLFEARERLRELEGKKPLVSYFKQESANKEIESAVADPVKSDDNYEYIFYNQSYAVFPEGASVEYSSMAMKMLNNSGVEKWKETSIPYNSYIERLIIEKAEVVKKNGQKVKAEQNYNQLVFPSLEVGDAVYIEYRIENYTQGKLRKEFWHNFVFNDFAPTRKSKFKIFTPKNYFFDIKSNLGDKKPDTLSIDDFTCYEWSFNNPPKVKSESYMPTLNEIGMFLDISTVKNWKTIANWYSDLVIPIAKEDYNINQVYNSIFENKNYSSTYEKAKAIYEYICETIRYSSVEFRQSDFVPQKPMFTVSTQLGDCKDLSTLYYTLAKKAGIKTNLVLVNTRSNGEETLKLPSVSFNHCIVRIDLDGKLLYQELTDRYLPFGYLPNNILNAQALVIPNSDKDSVGTTLIHIPNCSVGDNSLKRKISIKLENNQLQIKNILIANGSAASGFRSEFDGLTIEETMDKIRQNLSSSFSGTVNLISYNFENLSNQSENITYNNEFKVDNKIIKLGGLKAIKPIFIDDIFTSNVFTEDKRTYPILYWRYETVRYYETEITLELSDKEKFTELPSNFKLEKPYITYSLEVEKQSENKVKLIRKVKTNNSTLSSSVYDEFKQTISDIVKAEDVYLGFK